MDNLQITCRNLKVKQKQVKIVPVQSTDFTIKSAQRTGKTDTGSCADSQESHPVFPPCHQKDSAGAVVLFPGPQVCTIVMF